MASSPHLLELALFADPDPYRDLHPNPPPYPRTKIIVHHSNGVFVISILCSTMHRSASTTRVSDEYLVSMAQGGSRSVMEMDQLPTYDPQSEAAKKEILRARFAQNMVHLIPLVLIFCALVLWFFSNPDIDLASKDDAILARIKNLTIDGYSNWNVSSMAMSLESLDPIDATGVEQTGSVLENKVLL